MFNKIILTLLIIITLGLTLSINAQNIDSLLQRIDIATKQAIEENKQINSNICKDSANIKERLMFAYQNTRTKPDSSFLLLNKALSLSTKCGSLKYISMSAEGFGDYFFNLEKYSNATPFYLASLKIEEISKNEIRFANICIRLGIIYIHNEVTEKALGYYQKALSIYQKYNDTINIAGTYSNIAHLHFERNFWEQNPYIKSGKYYDSSIHYYKKAIAMLKSPENDMLIARFYQGMASVYNRTEEPEKALECIEKTVNIYNKQKNPEQVCDAMYALAITYDNLGKHQLAIKNFHQLIDSSKKYNISGIHWVYEKLAEAYYKAADYKKSHEMYIMYINTRDSIINLEKSQQILDIETKYQTEKKEATIATLIKEKRLTRLITITAITILILVIVVLFLIQKSIKTKKQLAEQQIEKLEQEKQLIATRSVLKGEEAERARMATDLHDGLGGLLSSAKINLASMKGNMILTSENVSLFNHALSLLDSSISELRRVAHNLMPATLNHYGLHTALGDYAKQVSPHDQPKVRFIAIGENIRYNKELELTAYRIAQELVNNAMKHANAKTIDMQLFTEPNRLCIQITDDGVGFEPNEAYQKEGKGLKSIRDRVTTFNGKINIWSKASQGAEIMVEFGV